MRVEIKMREKKKDDGCIYNKKGWYQRLLQKEQQYGA